VSDFTMLNRIERVPELNRCSSKAIALWSMLHHALDRRGRVELGGADFKTVLVRRLAIDPGDRQWFHAALRELETAGLFVVEGDVFQLVGHAGAGTSDAPKKGRGRRASTDLPPTSDGPSTDLPPTSVRPTTDLPPTSSGPSTDLPLASAQDDSSRDPQRREEKSREEEIRGEERKGSGESPSAPPPAAPDPEPEKLTEAIRDLEVRYPPGLCAEARTAVALSRRNGRVADSVWLRTLRLLDAHPIAAATHAMQVFVERHADGDKGEAYLVAIARREAAGARPGARRASVATPGTHELFDRTYVPERDDPELAWKETANA
jgi:hypothetical protein